VEVELVMEKRLIETDFPLKQTSLDSLHEKSIRRGHISTLQIWPARRPLAASRAALIATLLPNPDTTIARKSMLEKLGGSLTEIQKRKKLPNGKLQVKVAQETKGGILHWGREVRPDVEWFRAKIKEAFDGQAPKILDPFAGGGAIPLEAMRAGCEATAVEINPVAWFILKCTLEYPQRLAGQQRPLPPFAVESAEFMEKYYKGTARKTSKKLVKREREMLGRRSMPRLLISHGMSEPGVGGYCNVRKPNWHPSTGLWTTSLLSLTCGHELSNARIVV
jgi:putative DNA methylase